MIRSLKDFLIIEMALLWVSDILVFSALIYIAWSFNFLSVNLTIPFPKFAVADLVRFQIFAVLSGYFIGLYRPKTYFHVGRMIGSLFVILTLRRIYGLTFGQNHNGYEFHHADLSAVWSDYIIAALVFWMITIVFTRFFYSKYLRLHGVELDKTMSSSNATVVSFGEFRSLPAEAGATPIRSITCENFRQLHPDDLKRQNVATIVVPAEFRALVDDQALIRCRAAGIRVLNEVEFQETSTRSIDIDRLSNGWLAYGNILGGGFPRAAARRIFDVVLSLTMLVVTAPLLILTAIAIKLDSPGPVLYRQTRIGLFGRPFEIVKFRTMRIDAEVEGAPRWAMQRDPRITKIGGLLRLFRVDELPQLVNVLGGEMSVIGPRPERPQFVTDLAAQIPHYRDRSFAKPGITGWAQVNYPYGASVEDARRKLSYDLYYIKHRSLWLDLRICFTTIRVILLREGAR